MIRGSRRWSPISSTTPARFPQPGGEVRIRLAGRGRAEARADARRDRRRGRRAGHSRPCARAHLRAFLHRPPERRFRPEFRPRPFDLAPDRAGPFRPPLGGESAARRRTPRRARPTTVAPPRRRRALHRQPAGLPMSASIHASAVLVGRARRADPRRLGRGQEPAGAGARRRARGATGDFAALVADDRVWLEAVSGRLIARGAPALGGRLRTPRRWPRRGAARAGGGAAADRRPRRSRRRRRLACRSTRTNMPRFAE